MLSFPLFGLGGSYLRGFLSKARRVGGLLFLGRITLSSLTRDLIERVYILKGPPLILTPKPGYKP